MLAVVMFGRSIAPGDDHGLRSHASNSYFINEETVQFPIYFRNEIWIILKKCADLVVPCPHFVNERAVPKELET